MTGFVSVRCESCGGREKQRHIEHGDCRDCRGVDRCTDATGYVSPDAVEQRSEALDLAEQRSRQRVIENAVIGE